MSNQPEASQPNPIQLTPLEPVGVYHVDESIFSPGEYRENSTYPVKIKLSRRAVPLEVAVAGDVIEGARIEGSTLIYQANLALLKRNTEFIKSRIAEITLRAEYLRERRQKRLQELKELADSIRFTE